MIQKELHPSEWKNLSSVLTRWQRAFEPDKWQITMPILDIPNFRKVEIPIEHVLLPVFCARVLRYILCYDGTISVDNYDERLGIDSVEEEQVHIHTRTDIIFSDIHTVEVNDSGDGTCELSLFWGCSSLHIQFQTLPEANEVADLITMQILQNK